MTSDTTREAADRDVAYRRSPQIGRAHHTDHSLSSEERFAFPTRLLRHPAIRGYGNTQAHTMLIGNLQRTYGNLQTRRVVQRSVSISEFDIGTYTENEEQKRLRQRDMSLEERVAEFASETDYLDESWAQMTPQERQGMIEGQQQQTRAELEMREAELAADPDAYLQCPDPTRDDCGRSPRSPF